MPRDPDLFKGTAHFYARYRPGYPDALFQRVIDAFGLDGAGRLLDLGCGSGQLAIPLARHVAEAVGVDPDPDMLAEAAVAAERHQRRNIRWIQGSDRDLDQLGDMLGRFRLGTMGQSFHWMDQDTTLRDLDRLIEPDGGIALVGAPERIWSGTETWHAAVRAVIQRWLGRERRAGSGAYTVAHDPFEEILARSPFSRVESFVVPDRRKATVEEIIGYLYSTSYCSPAILGDLREPFEDDLRRTLRDLDPAGVFSEEVEVIAFLARRHSTRTKQRDD